MKIQEIAYELGLTKQAVEVSIVRTITKIIRKMSEQGHDGGEVMLALSEMGIPAQDIVDALERSEWGQRYLQRLRSELG
jgi:hypothetical protein